MIDSYFCCSEPFFLNSSFENLFKEVLRTYPWLTYWRNSFLSISPLLPPHLLWGGQYIHRLLCGLWATHLSGILAWPLILQGSSGRSCIFPQLSKGTRRTPTSPVVRVICEVLATNSWLSVSCLCPPQPPLPLHSPLLQDNQLELWGAMEAWGFPKRRKTLGHLMKLMITFLFSVWAKTTNFLYLSTDCIYYLNPPGICAFKGHSRK